MMFDSRFIIRVNATVARTVAALGIVGGVACGAGSIVDVPANAGDRTIAAAAGQEIDVTLRNVGPAIYLSPPTISSDAVTYLGVDVVPPYNPGGPTQRFRLRASHAGQAIVTFRRVLGDSLVSTVEDTVQVR